jgi:flagellin
MGDVVLSAGVRQNLLSLQSTAELMSLTQNRLATGKKVNSALDSPFNFFTSQALNHRASDLNSLLDAIGQSQKTIEAANHGITAITKLVESAKSIAKQAQQTTAPAATYSLNIAGNTAIAADTPAGAASTATLASVLGSATASNMASLEIDATDLANDLTDGQTIEITYNGNTVTFEYDDDASGGAGSNVAFTDTASFVSALEAAFGASNVSENAGTITLTGTNFTNSFTTAGTGAGAVVGTNTNAVDGDTLTVSDGTNTGTFRLVAGGSEDAAAGTFSDLATLQAALAASPVTGVTFADDGAGNLEISSTGNFTVGGQLGTDLGFGNTPYQPTNATLSALSGSLSVQVGSGPLQTINFGGVNVTTRAELLAELNTMTGVTATINGGGLIEITSTTADSVTIGGTDAAAFFAVANIGANTPTGTVVTANTVRANLEVQFNEILSQIDALARDASYNGVNLLHGDDLRVIFNEDGSSFLNITGVTFTSAGLGMTNLAGGEFQTNNTIDTVLGQVDGALRALRSQATNFGSKLGTVQTRQEFTKQLINTLETGADNLVLADTNEEGANLLALQTRQQLSTTALSLSAQADQAVLRLFG